MESIDPKMWGFLIQLVKLLQAAPAVSPGDEFDVDLPTLRDRMGMKDLINGGASPKPAPLPVQVVGGAPWPYATGSS